MAYAAVDAESPPEELVRFAAPVEEPYEQPAAAARQGATDRARAATRAFEILEYFRETGRPARTAEIGRALKIPNSSADDLLRALLAKGYLGFDNRTKFYSPSYRLISIANDFLAGFPILSSLHKLEDSLRLETGQAVVVVAQEGPMMRVVSMRESDAIGPKSIRVGSLTPLAQFDDRSGWTPTSNFAGAILAANTDLEIVSVLSALEEPGRLTNFNRLLDRIRTIRATGCALCTIPGPSSIASHARWLRRIKEMPVVAVGCVGLSGEIERWQPYFGTALRACNI